MREGLDAGIEDAIVFQCCPADYLQELSVKWSIHIRGDHAFNREGFERVFLDIP